MDPNCVSDDAVWFERTEDENLLLQDSKGEPTIVPRIGEEYQAQLSPLVRNSIYKSEATFSPDLNFVIGLPVLFTYTSSKNEKNFGSDLRENANLRLVPGLSDVEWNESEKKIFLLGLYIFEKDFIEIKNFLETKETGALLYFYYGKFYGSQEYRRWYDCRKVKGRKSVNGRRLFSGLRQQELLSRILPRVSEEHQNALLEVSKTFADEKMSLADYVYFVKKKVSVEILVEAVGIGTGKRDLTTMASETTRTNHGISFRSEIPIGKACSSLTVTEIVKFLSGDYRLSKARSSDLFWEAVWPRLLARGWHSEQPKDYTGSKNTLVFLVPDVKKFSRRKLVKGDDYFDSVSDVLSKVGREPGLIRLENEGFGDDCCVKKEEYSWSNGREYNEHPVRKKPCFLQPKTPKRSINVMKFTVVDTMSDGKIRELRALPSEVFEDVSTESDFVDSKTKYQDSCSATLASVSKKRKNICKKHSSEKLSKSRKLKHDIVPTKKESKINAIMPQTSIGSKVNTEIQGCCSGTNEAENVSFCADKLSSAGSCRGSPISNFPQTSPNSEDPVFTKEQEITSIKQEEIQKESNLGIQSKRNRALTSRAMEALVNGYLTVNRRRKADTNLPLRRPQRARVRATPDESMNSCAGSQVAAQGENSCCHSKDIMNGSEAQFQVPEQENGKEASEDFQVGNGASWDRQRSL